MTEEEIIEEVEKELRLAKNVDDVATTIRNEYIQGLLDLYQKEKEKNIKAGELLGKRINMCNQFQIELDKEKEKNKELEEYLEVVSKELDNIAYDQILFAINEKFISKDKIREKIKEYEKPIKFSEIDKYGEIIEGTMICRDKIEALQELLEERN